MLTTVDGARPPPRSRPGLLIAILLAVFGGVCLLPLEIGLARMGLSPGWPVLGLALLGLVLLGAVLAELNQARVRPKAAMASVVIAPGGSGELTMPLAASPLAVWIELDIGFAVEAGVIYVIRVRLDAHTANGEWSQTYGVEWQIGKPHQVTHSALAKSFGGSRLPAGSIPPELGVDLRYGEGRYRGYARLCTLPAGPLSLRASVEGVSWATAMHARCFVSSA